MAETELKDFQNQILQLATSNLRDTNTDRNTAKNRTSLIDASSVLGQLRDMAKQSAADRDATSDSGAQMQVDQNSNMANNTGS